MANISRPAFSPESHKIIALGIPMSGFANGTYLSITPNADVANYDAGADGEVMVNIIPQNTATAKLRVNYDNPASQLLRAAVVAFQTTGVYLPFSSTNLANPLDTTVSINANPMRFSEDNYAVNAADMYREFPILLHNALRV